jgi:hypothetical protein
MHPRIEKSGFRKGEYVGYCKGAQRIRRTSYGWQTYALASSAGEFVAASGRTLKELGNELELRDSK